MRPTAAPEAPEGLLPPLPAGLDPWLVEFIEDAERDSAILRENGAHEQAAARDNLLRKLIEAAEAWLSAEIDTTEAAELLDCCEETVRRKVRDKELPDRRSNPRGQHRLRRGDVLDLARTRRTKYDPTTDAQDIAQLRRKAS